MTIDAAFLGRLVEIVWINILLSGDNAVVIALACRTLPPRQRRWGIILGTTPAVVLLIVFAAIVSYLLRVPGLKLAGGAMLLWIATDLLRQEEEEQTHVRAGATLWAAIRIIVAADLVMSLDNVIAIAAAAKGSMVLLAIGLAVSVPLVIGGAAILLKLLTRFPVLIWAGGALLGYIAGELATGDLLVEPWIRTHAPALTTAVPILGAAAVVSTGHLLARAAARRARTRPR